MVVKVQVILERLRALDEYIRLLQPYREWNVRRLTDDRITYGGILHYLQLAVQIVMDVSSHLNVELDLPRVSDYQGAIQSMGAHGVLPSEFAERITGMAGFRNVLVHEYLTVDPLKVRGALQDGIEDLKAFIVHITEFLRQEGYLDEETAD